MIRVKKGTPLTLENLAYWYSQFLNEKSKRTLWRSYYENMLNGQNIVTLPFAKKLVLTAASATVGDGVSYSEPDDLNESQKLLYDEIMRLFEAQNSDGQNKKIVIEAGATGTGYELCYMSDDEQPVPKVAKIKSENAFVVFDDTVECNSLYAVYFDEYKVNNVQHVKMYVYDNENYYVSELQSWKEPNIVGVLGEPIPHNMGRVPLTKMWNNEEEQADFAQVINLINDRDFLHDLTLADTKKIVKNILAIVNAKLAGKTVDEKSNSRDSINEVGVLELESGGMNPASVQMLSKNENYGMITEFGKDLDSKIYDLTMIPDLTSDTFAGNVTGVALELKLLPFKELVKLKEENLIALVKRRLKMYAYALTRAVEVDGNVISSDYEWFDTDDITVTIHRNWTKNLIEISQMISMLQTTQLFSKEFLTNLMPDADYQVEKERKRVESEDEALQQTTQADANNFSLENFNSLFRSE